MKVYISGPITNKDPEVQAANIAKFYVAEEKLLAEGYTVCNPNKLDHSKCESKWYKYMKVALIGMLLCDGIYMLDGHRNSTGACIEYALSKTLSYIEVKNEI